MEIIESPQAVNLINNYPKEISKKLHFLRSLIIQTAIETSAVEKIEETLKWGEPSYITKNGSTIRIDWKRKTPHQYAMYFHCKTKLVDTFKEVYQDTFIYESNRAIIFTTKDRIPIDELKHCIELSLNYHTIKNLPLLGL